MELLHPDDLKFPDELYTDLQKHGKLDTTWIYVSCPTEVTVSLLVQIL